MSASQAGPSKDVPNAPRASRYDIEPESLEKFELAGKEETESTSHKLHPPHDHHRSSSADHGPSYLKIGSASRRLSRDEAYADAERLRNSKLRQFVKTWKCHIVLTLDGGGVRGYSQLLILKALMEKVERIERSEPIDNQAVDSSFHPIPWCTIPSTPAARRRVKSRSNNFRGSNGTDNSGEGKGKGKATVISTLPSAAECSHFYPHHYFDWIAGTSTGGLNAIMLSRLRMSVDECLDEYADLAKEVFGKPRWASYRFSPFFWFCAKYSGRKLEAVINRVVEAHLREGEGACFAMNPYMCRTVVVAMRRNEKDHDVVNLFKSYAHHERRQNIVEGNDYSGHKINPLERGRPGGPADTSLIWQVARATSAAPSYFSSIKIGNAEYIDGGFGQNNPSTSVFWEVSQVNRDVDAANTLSVSIGTGITRFSRFQKGFLKKPIGWFNAAKKLSTDCERDHNEMRNITKDGRKYGYFRFNVPERRTDPGDLDFDPEKASPSLAEWLSKRLLRIFKEDSELLERGLGKIKLDKWKEERPWRKESTKDEIERVTRAYLAEDTVDRNLEVVARKLVDL